MNPDEFKKEIGDNIIIESFINDFNGLTVFHRNSLGEDIMTVVYPDELDEIIVGCGDWLLEKVERSGRIK